MLNPKTELFLIRFAALPVAIVSIGTGLGDNGVATPGEERRHVDGLIIKAPPQRIFDLLDPASSAHRWRIRRDELSAIDLRSGVYRLNSPSLPGQPILIRVLQRHSPTTISHECSAESGGVLGAALSSQSNYDIEPVGDGARVALTETTRFKAGLSGASLAAHSFLMKLSVRMDLLRLKYEAETGRDADAQPGRHGSSD
jgi:hypothetical protein